MIPPPIRCSFNFPGHHPHRGRVNLFLGRQVIASGEVAALEQVHRTGVRLYVVGGGEHIYRNHQPERIVAAFDERDGPALLYVTDGFLEVRDEQSAYFFSLAREEFRTCRKHRQSIRGLHRASL